MCIESRLQSAGCSLCGQEDKRLVMAILPVILTAANTSLNTAHCTLNTEHCTLHTAHCTLHTAHYTLHTAHCTLHTSHCTACGVFIQKQWPAMLADCAPILIWIRLSRDEAPNGLISKCTLRFGRWGLYAHPNWNLSTIRQHCRPLPLDRHTTCLCLDNIIFWF